MIDMYETIGMIPYTDIDVIRMDDGRAYALDGWNGEHYSSSWELEDWSVFPNRRSGWREVLGKAGRKVVATPIYQYDLEDDLPEDFDQLPEEEQDRLNQVVDFRIVSR